MTDNAGLKGAAQIAAEQVASTKNVRIKPDIVERLRAGEPCQPHDDVCRSIEARSGCICAEAADALEVCQAERDQARRSATFWNENSVDLSAQIAERTDALIAAKARVSDAEAEIERLRTALDGQTRQEGKFFAENCRPEEKAMSDYDVIYLERGTEWVKFVRANKEET